MKLKYNILTEKSEDQGEKPEIGTKKSAVDETMLEISGDNNTYHVRHAKPDAVRCWISKDAGTLDFDRVQQMLELDEVWNGS